MELTFGNLGGLNEISYEMNHDRYNGFELTYVPLIEMKIGRWGSEGHKNKEKDDSHDIQKKILDAVGEVVFGKIVGKNPDIDIDKKAKKIILRGTKMSPFKGKKFDTDLDVEDYFIFYIYK